jgi:glycosyltransferase involved in cell wall biosynthesis
VIRALPSVPGVHFRIIGTGPDESILRSLAKELGVQDRVTFVGFLQNSKLPEELHKSDIFIRPSRSEGFGISFVEAFAAGLPVIATREGGIADFLTTETGWPVAKDSPVDIAVAINDIIARPDHVKKVVATAKKLTFETYDWNLIAKDMRAKVFNLL